MRVEKMTDKLTFASNESQLVGHWPKSDPLSTVPIYHANTIHAFNRLIGYAKFKNGSIGTVLYRGQNIDHGSLVPSGARPMKTPLHESVVKAICDDEDFLNFIQLNDSDIAGWKEYQRVIVESIIQHYSGNTYCMDFVDNHWCALWFGVYEFEEKSCQYHIRTDSTGNLYIYLYVADTVGATIRGMSIGDDTYTVDLRKALPSTFQRPASQHGWVVRKKTSHLTGCNYDDRVVGVIEVNVSDAINWLGNGILLSQENFFPSYDIDQGYSVLLQRQFRSGLVSTYEKVLPSGTIRNYNLMETYYCSDTSKPIIAKKRLVIDGNAVDSIEPLYAALLKTGWQRDTCEKSAMWKEENPSEYQSAPTALLVQRYFGGDIGIKTYKGFAHYYNIIGSTVIDLTYQSLSRINGDFYKAGKNIGSHPSSTWERYGRYLQTLIDNCKIDDTIRFLSPGKKKGST